MAKVSKAVDAPEEYEGEEWDEDWVEPSPGLRLLWLVGLVLWGLLAAALVSYDAADPPGHAVAPANGPDELSNLVGMVGATTAHHALMMLGSGVWVLLIASGASLAYVAFRRPIDHVVVRGLGVVMVALAASSLHALYLPAASSFPEGAGGLLAIAGVHELTLRFGTLGATMWVLLLAAIGATVAFDRWLVVVPSAIGAGISAIREYAARGADAARDRLLAFQEARANDIDDDEQLAEVSTVVRAAAKRQKLIGSAPEPAKAEPARKLKKRRPEVEAEIAPEPDDTIEDDVQETPGAPQVFSKEELRDKIARLPVRFANASKNLASEDDLETLRAQRASEEEADRKYVFPGLDLLTDPEENYAEELEGYIREQAAALENALSTYRINGHVAGVDSGPVITLYQVALAPGTKVSSVNAVVSDLARMLRATNIRIVPNTEGLDTIGIEVPNSKKEKVRLKELMASTEGTRRMKLPLFLGKDASGAPLIVDLAALPHLLIAGTTGSGKSVCMNAIIMGFLYTQKPSDLKLVLVDPKMVELSQFKDIPHLMCPVVTEMSKAAAILEWAVKKMDERYELLAEAGCRDINAYNSLGWDELKDRLRPSNEIEEARIPRKLPFLVFVIDELADLIMSHKEVETSIVRIAQKARAVGIHMIIATQRPQANVVTGLIKSNMPGRITFKVASGMDSRIVMDQKGGELLLGQGDMLMLTPRSSTSVRAQGTLVDDGEARRVVRFIREHASQNFEGQLVTIANHGYEAQVHEDRMRESAQEDPLFDRAVELVLESGRGSVSMLQRRLAIGYTRSARLVEMMGEAGIIGTHKGTVAREVTMTLEEWHAIKEMAEAEPQEPAPSSLFPEDVATASEVTPGESEALLGGTFVETHDDNDATERLIDVNPTPADTYANTVDLDEKDEEEAVPFAVAKPTPEPEREPERAPEPQLTQEPVETAPVVETTIEEDTEEDESADAVADMPAEEAEVIAEAKPAVEEVEDEHGQEEEEEYEYVDEDGNPIDPEDVGEIIEEEEEEEEEVEAELDGNAEAEASEDGEEEEEYEYEYVDEEGNPIDPEDLDDNEYDLVDEEEEAAEAPKAEPRPEVSTDPLKRQQQGSAA